ncbi:MAG: hypothetical protein ACREJ2_09905, partial [Planctomycetota bacterium]
MPTRPEKPPHTPAPPAAIGSKPAAAPRLRLPRAPHLLLILLALAQLTAPLLAAETPSTASTVLTAAFPAAAALNPSAPAPTPAPTAAATASPAARSPAALPGSPPLHPPAAKKHPAASPPEPPTPPTPPAPPAP